MCGSCSSPIWSHVYQLVQAQTSSCHGMSVGHVKEVSSCIKSWLELSIETLSTSVRDHSTYPSPKGWAPSHLGVRRGRRPPQCWGGSHMELTWYGGCVCVPLRYRTFINNILMWRSHRSPGFLVSQEAFWNCDDASGRLTKSSVSVLQTSLQLAKHCLFDREKEEKKEKEKKTQYLLSKMELAYIAFMSSAFA